MSDHVSADEFSPGVWSRMRWGVRVAVWSGVAMIAASIVLAFGMLVTERYELIPVAVAMISGGPGLIVLSLGAKAWQSQAEEQGRSPGN